MTLDQLITLYRSQSMDSSVPFFCDDALLMLYANEAQVEACRRGQLLVRTSVVAAQPGAEDIALPAGAVHVLRSSANGHELHALVADEMDCLHPGWQDDGAQGDPRFLVSGVNTDKLNLWPRPSAECRIRLTVQSLPGKPMRCGADAPEIRPELHAALVDWMLYKAYSRTDGDLFDPGKAAASLANFEAEFGRKASGRNETWVRQGVALMPGPIA